jgi:NAD(P)-dependent dehydrogenase (short-subunit alcohol dehydrogenase family)
MTTRVFLAALVLLLASVSSPARADDGPWDGLTVLVTGANRGLGLEFARQLHSAGATVIGTARNPAEATELAATGARVVQLDVADAASVAALAEELAGEPIDALLNNAGIFPSRGGLESLDPEQAARVYAVNTLGPMRLTQSLLPNLRQGRRKLVMNMSSGLGSIANNGRGGAMGYRESKAALNMFTRSLHAELSDEGFVCIAMSPGWVRTDMGGESAPLSPEQSVRGMLSVLAEAGPDESGRYFEYSGDELPW